jgi:hypothetical protein
MPREVQLHYKEERMPSPWWLVLSPIIIAVNLYLLLTLSRWFEVIAVLEILVATLLALIAALHLTTKKAPTLLQIMLWGSLASMCLLYQVKPLVLDLRIEQIGTDRLLTDARSLAEGLGISGSMRPEILAGESLLIPPSLRALRPESVRVEAGAVCLLLDVGVSSEEAIVISTDPKIVPGRAEYNRETKYRREFGENISQRLIAPGIWWHSSSS